MNETLKNGEKALAEIFSDPATLNLIEGGLLAAKEFFLARQYIAEVIASFDGDPADSDFQLGYLEALRVVGREALGMDIPDPELPVGERRSRPKFVVHEGGK